MNNYALPEFKAPGDPLYANDINKMTKAIRAAQAAVNSIGCARGGGSVGGEPCLIVAIRNDTGADILPGTIWGITGTIDEENPALRIFTIREPETPDDIGRWVVAASLIPDKTSGPAYFHGICLVTVSFLDEDSQDYQYADLDLVGGSSTITSEKLIACGDGCAEILWHEPLGSTGIGDVKALIRFPRIRQGKMAKCKATISKDFLGDVSLCYYDGDLDEYIEYGPNFLALNVGPSNAAEGDVVMISEDEKRRPFFLR